MEFGNLVKYKNPNAPELQKSSVVIFLSFLPIFKDGNYNTPQNFSNVHYSLQVHV